MVVRWWWVRTRFQRKRRLLMEGSESTVRCRAESSVGPSYHGNSVWGSRRTMLVPRAAEMGTNCVAPGGTPAIANERLICKARVCGRSQQLARLRKSQIDLKRSQQRKCTCATSSSMRALLEFH